ncbi:hypothetical protein RCL1_000435 [Eukaryota sp. TZLM3-RCL]
MTSSFTPYSNITVFSKGKATILGRVYSLVPLKTFSKGQGGQVFSFNLIDALSRQIKVTAFGNKAESVAQSLSEGDCVSISKFNVKMADLRYNNTGCDYEILLTTDSIVSPYSGPEAEEIQILSGDFRTIAEVSSLSEGEFVDVIAVLKSKSELSKITSQKFEGEISKIDCVICDDSTLNGHSGLEVELTAWSKNADFLQSVPVNTILSLSHVKITVFREIFRLSTVSQSRVKQAPLGHEVAANLFSWVNTFKSSGELVSTTPVSALVSVTSSQLPVDTSTNKVLPRSFFNELASFRTVATSPMTFCVRGTILEIKAVGSGGEGPIFYESCPDCKRKLEKIEDVFTCKKCQTQKEPVVRFMARLVLADETGSITCTAFDDVVEKIIGVCAKEMAELSVSNEVLYNRYIESAVFTVFSFTLRLKTEQFNNEDRLNCSVVTVNSCNHAEDASFLYNRYILPVLPTDDDVVDDDVAE